MDFHKLISRYQQFGGTRLVIEYARLGALRPAIRAGIRCVVKKQSFKQIYPAVLKKVEPMLVEKYGAQIPQIAQRVSNNNHNDASTSSATVRPIWFCWLQGIENAPEIVHACYNSIKRNIPDREINVIDSKNWSEYVEMPEYIIKKWEKGRIPAALFSDLLRLELLIKYGGTWIDSTVLCTGFKGSKVDLSVEPAHAQHTENKFSSAFAQSQPSKFKEYLDAELFLFQYTKQGSIPVSISNWFITACSNNEVLMVLRNMLYAYWKDYDCTLDYYIFHLFFSMISKEYPEEILSMPYGQSMNSLALLHHWGERFDQQKWDKLTSHVSFHKLAYRVSEETKKNKESYYYHILEQFNSSRNSRSSIEHE